MATDYSTAELAARRLEGLRIAWATKKANYQRQSEQIAPSVPRYADMPEWERLASEAGVRLPQFRAALSTAVMRRWLRKLGIPTSAYLAWDGSRTLGDFAQRNPTWTARAWAGLILEHRDLIAPATLTATSATPTGPGERCEINIGRQPIE